MDKKLSCILGLDTSNYTTSAALVDLDGNIIADSRKLLEVKKGARGLRQSEALFNHVKNLPDIVDDLMRSAKKKSDKEIQIVMVAASEKPRPIEGSYMPCFLPGQNFGKSLASILNVDYKGFSHQEGHIETLLGGSGFSKEKGFMCFHLSGGTCELIEIKDTRYEIIGGSLDISFGQLLDRIGVAMGMKFPAGAELDEIAYKLFQSIESLKNSDNKGESIFKKVKCIDAHINLSGIESAAMREIEKSNPDEFNLIIMDVFQRVAQAIVEISLDGSKKTKLSDVLLVGGVSGSKTVKKHINEIIQKKDFIDSKLNFYFGDSSKSRDNAIGIALLGRKTYGNKTN